MAALEKFLDRLKRRKVEEALSGLRTPVSKDAFELGRLCGIQHGLTIAEQLLHEAIKDDEQPEPDDGRKKTSIRPIRASRE